MVSKTLMHHAFCCLSTHKLSYSWNLLGTRPVRSTPGGPFAPAYRMHETWARGTDRYDIKCNREHMCQNSHDTIILYYIYITIVIYSEITCHCCKTRSSNKGTPHDIRSDAVFLLSAIGLVLQSRDRPAIVIDCFTQKQNWASKWLFEKPCSNMMSANHTMNEQSLSVPDNINN